MKTTIIALSTLIVGFLAGYNLSPKSEIDTDSIKEELTHISETQLASLEMIENQEERFEKANEIYGKIFIMFLAQLGIRMNTMEWDPLLKPGYLPHKDDHEQDEELAVTPHDKTKINPPQLSTSTQEDITKPQAIPKQTPTEATKDYQQAAVFKKISPLMNKIQGSFSGVVYDIKGKEKDIVWDIIMDVNYAHDGKEYQGEARITLSSAEQGEFSRNRSTGDNRAFQGNAHKPHSLYIEVSPSSYIEVNMKGNGPIFHGVLYSMKGGTKFFEYQGKLKISRN